MQVMKFILTGATGFFILFVLGRYLLKSSRFSSKQSAAIFAGCFSILKLVLSLVFGKNSFELVLVFMSVGLLDFLICYFLFLYSYKRIKERQEQ